MHIGSFRAGSIANTLFGPFASGSEKFDWNEKIRNKDAFYAALDVWEKSGGIYEQRDRAAWIVRDAFKRGADYVNLSGLGLESLPPLPSVRMLNVSNNELKALSEILPASLEKIIASNNRLFTIPVLPGSVTYADFSTNSIGLIPDLSRLEHIDLHNNFLPEVPVLSTRARYVDLRNNVICKYAAEELSLDCTILLEDNFLSPGAVKYPWTGKVFPEHPELSWEMRGKWREILHGEEYAKAEQFWIFLEKLRNALEMTPEDFRPGVAIWLERLGNCDALRKETFDLAIDGLGECEDRVLLTLKLMETALVSDDIRQGKYDKSLPKLIAMAREIFRLEQIKNVSNEIVLNRTHADAVEVELHLNVALREPLVLSTGVRTMHYLCSSRLGQSNFDQAEARVKCAENTIFLRWLATWPAWDDAVKRLEPALFEKAEDAWQDRLALWLAESKQAIAEGRKIANHNEECRETNDMTDKFIQEARMKRDADFAVTHGCAEQLKPLWNLETGRLVRKLIQPRQPLLHMMRTSF